MVSFSIIYQNKLQFFAFAILAQSSIDNLQQYFNETKNGSYATAPKSLFDEGNDFNVLLTELKEYQSDSIVRIRSIAYSLSSRFGQMASDSETQQKAIDQQIKALNDSDKGIAGNAINALTNFKNTTFSETQKIEILSLLNQETPHLNGFVKLVGFLEIEGGNQSLNTY